MATQGGGSPNLPLDDRSKDLKITIPVLTIFCTTFVVIRMIVSWRNRKGFLLSDYLLVLGAGLNIPAVIFSYLTASEGQGRHVWDPFLNQTRLRDYLHHLWWAQLLNIYAMAAVKGSICAYLMLLDFSKMFRIMIWVSVVIHISTNFIFPSVILFGECNPISKHWNPQEPGRCWGDKPRVVSGYVGAGSNILTDLFYTSAPLVYLSSVQLSRRTKMGVRAVFLLGLITTTISALKFYEMRALHDSKDPTYTSVNLSIYSMTEVAAGIFTACLPPLRKTFENFLRRVLPESIMGSSTTKKKGSQYEMPAYGSNLSRSENSKPKHDLDRDSDSERAILPDGSERTILPEKSGAHGGETIVRTTHISVYGEQGKYHQMDSGNFV
ncbi:uncharacterized protein BDR25DRAFT_282887 [Lindgomyces ingoldianus]|uniref:Uncharacterized protein n=1 Tax=Lindgomyces ingoldianus TaxID=673940 RepID=A0ACB6R4E3_9PLEO|nr:uncharacterized protein BDR25DRAFT_282887 [Lindgomyces ingoldianus]KAF2473382.1 hypothetical protein BDR25DRAFT_282887 [Lindgomyces ingoldianus]